jgi:hypothetical protein
MRFKILRTAYRRLPQDQLAIFAKDVLDRTQNVPEYSAIQKEVEVMAPLALEYPENLTKSRKGNVEDRVRKELLKGRLIQQIDSLATVVETKANALGDVLYILQAGFTPVNARQISTGPVETARNLHAVSTGLPGQIRITLEDPSTNIVRTHEVRYSTDQGQTWVTCAHSVKTNFIVDGLPNLTALWIQVRILASRDRFSPWTQHVVVSVL